MRMKFAEAIAHDYATAAEWRTVSHSGCRFSFLWNHPPLFKSVFRSAKRKLYAAQVALAKIKY
ncbi:MAG: hypothetical protein E7612_06725 [Ruminococcaceae bacterium]|nr:hypothetical protein [Oscillospiraceae bacterium]